MNNDLIILGVPHAGTSLIARMVHALGWEPNDANEAYAESVGMRDINRTLLGELPPDERPAEARMVAFMAGLKRPFALKDPRLVLTIGRWMPAFASIGAEPLLLMITKDPASMQRSYLERNESVRGAAGNFGRTLDELMASAREEYRLWPFAKVTIAYENLIGAALLAKQDRDPHRGGGLWLNTDEKSATRPGLRRAGWLRRAFRGY